MENDDFPVRYASLPKGMSIVKPVGDISDCKQLILGAMMPTSKTNQTDLPKLKVSTNNHT